MADREPVDWITVHHKKVPIFEGESKQDAVNRAIAKDNTNIRTKQIEQNEQQANQLKAAQLPRRLPLADITAEVANKTTNVLNLGTKQRFRFKDGTKVIVFSGKGCSKEFRDAAKYAKRWGGKAEDWQHCAGTAQITDGKKVLTREVHWVQGKDGKMREAFIKYYNNQGGRKS